MLRVLLGLLILISTLPTIAQDPLYFRYTDENGLPDAEVYELLQDSRGFIWIATAKGLARYDGTAFKHYTSKKQVNASITGIYEDFNQKIWVHDFTGRIFYVESDTLHYFEQWNPNNSFSFPQLTVHQENLWVNTYEGVHLYDLSKGGYLKKHWKIPTTRSISNIGNNMYVISLGKIIYISPTLDTLSLFGNSQPLYESTGGYAFNIQDQHYIFTYRKNYILEIKYKEKKLIFYQALENTDFTYKAKKIGQKFYVCTANGLHIFGQKGYQWQKIGHYFKGMRVSNIIQDHEGHLWLSTLNNGLLQVPSLNTKNIILSNEDKAQKILAYKNGFLLGTDHGKVYKNNELVYTDTFQRGISALNIRQKDETILAAGNYLYEIKNKKVIKTKYFNHGFKQWDYLSNGISLFSTSSGFCLELPHKDFKQIPAYLLHKIDTEFNTPTFWSLTDIRSSFFVHDSLQKCIIVSTKNGLMKIDSLGKNIILYKNEPLYAISIAQVNDTYWAGTASNGIFILDKQTNVVKQLTTADGLLGNTVYKIVKGRESVWIATDNGLQQLDFLGNSKNYLSTQNGLFSNKINDLSFWQGTVYAATNRGVLIFSENFNNSLKPNPKLYLKNLQWQETDTLRESTTLQAIQLPFGYRRLVIELGIISFSDKNRISFQYRIKGLQNEHWTTAKATQNRIDLAALPSGAYVFEAYAMNPQGKATSGIFQLPIVVTPPFWRTFWFWSLIVLLLIIIVSLLIISRLRRLKERNDLLLEKEKLQKELQMSLLASIKSQMNPHFIFNALNTIQFYIFNNDKAKATHYLSKFSQLMRKILQMSNTEKVALSEEIEALKLYLTLEAMRFQEELAWKIEVAEEIDVEETYIPSMLIQPYVENAIKHGLLHQSQAKKLEVRITLSNEQLLQVAIEDNGIGRKKAEEMKMRKGGQHLSYSSMANSKRLAILNTNRSQKIALEIIDLENEVGEGIGTRVHLFIPLC
jgi:ligand-binding sensor domain-containing protein